MVVCRKISDYQLDFKIFTLYYPNRLIASIILYNFDNTCYYEFRNHAPQQLL